jgi:transcriptional regulator with XRE-family HTH domain
MEPGERLDKIREQKGWTKSKMAESIGLEPGSYSDIVRGKTKGISKAVLKLLEIVHNVNLEFLSGVEANMYKSEPQITIAEDPKTSYGQKKQLTNSELIELKALRELVDVYRKSNALYEKDNKKLIAENEMLKVEIAQHKKIQKR